MSAYIIEQAIEAYPRDFVGGGRDYKAWAKRILWREKNGDKTLLTVQVQFAKMAMDIKPEAAA